jgi:N6-adenosine-specific RNA methylase IME4/ParB-like chromosome segregation protein Spo0J
MALKFHSAADLFPLMSDADIDKLAEDIREHGLVEPIVVHRDDGSILDGRNRYLACKKAKVKPDTEQWDGPAGSEVTYVISRNLHRRHLNESQRAMIAARVKSMFEAEAKKRQLATLKRGKEAPAPVKENLPERDKGQSRDHAGEMFKVSGRSVDHAAKILKNASPELVQAVDDGTATLAQATKLMGQDHDTQRKVISRARETGKTATEAYRVVKAEHIAKAEMTKPSGKYRVILADPPWSYGNSMPPGTTEPRDHYPTMSLEDICALPVKDMAQDDAVLFLWVTSPLVPESMQVIEAWGFKYKASFVWDKVKHNMGHYNSVRHEFLWICVRGSCQPDVRKLFDSVVVEERTEHSKKPEQFYEIIDTLYPQGKRIELFARAARKGWQRWGFEAGESDA